MSTTDLIKILEISKKKNGADFPLTVGHLLNIVKMSQRYTVARIVKEAKEGRDLYDEFMTGKLRYGDD